VVTDICSAAWRQPNGLEVLNITAKSWQGERGMSTHRVTVRARPASAAPGAHQERYRPIDIDRRSMKKVESRLSPFSILLLYFLTAGADKK
jgi:hypothetical protein